MIYLGALLLLVAFGFAFRFGLQPGGAANLKTREFVVASLCLLTGALLTIIAEGQLVVRWFITVWFN